MIIFQVDIDGGSDPLPVRQGCGPGPCACSGECKKIIGYIGRKKYCDFLQSFISIETFIAKNFEKVVEEKRDIEKFEIINYSVEYNNRYAILREIQSCCMSGTILHEIMAFITIGGKNNPIFISADQDREDVEYIFEKYFLSVTFKPHYKHA